VRVAAEEEAARVAAEEEAARVAAAAAARGTECDVRRELRIKNYRLSYAGDECGHALARCLMAAMGDLTQKELSEPSDDVRTRERAWRSAVVGDNACLSLWKDAGYYDPDSCDAFLRAVLLRPDCRRPIVILDKISVHNVATNKWQKFYEFGTASRCYDGTDECLTKERLAALLGDDATQAPLLLERFGDRVSPFLRVPRPRDVAILDAIRDEDYGVWYDRSPCYAEPFLNSYNTYCEPAERCTLQSGQPLPPDFNYALVTIEKEHLKGSHGLTRAAQIFRYFEYGFRMRLALEGMPDKDCVAFSHDGVISTYLHTRLLPRRRAYAGEVTLQDILNLEQKLSKEKTGNATVDWAKMKQLYQLGATGCPSSGMPVWDPDKISAADKLKFEQMVKSFVDKSSVNKKRPRETTRS